MWEEKPQIGKPSKHVGTENQSRAVSGGTVTEAGMIIGSSGKSRNISLNTRAVPWRKL